MLKPAEVPVTLSLPDTTAHSILASMAEGELTPMQTASILTALAKAKELDAPAEVPAQVSLTIQFVSPERPETRIIEQDSD